METHVCKREKEIDKAIEDVSYLQKHAVSFTLFWSVITVALVITSAILTNAYSQIDELENKEAEFHKDIEEQVNGDRLVQTRIETQLAQIQKDILEVKKELIMRK